MEINSLSYKFKICVSIEEYNKAVGYLGTLSNFLVELNEEDIHLIRRLKKGLLKQTQRYMINLKETRAAEAKKMSKYIYKEVMNNYYNKVTEECIDQVKKFLNCLNSLISKVKENQVAYVINSIKAKMFSFMNEFAETENAKYLELAYSNYQLAVTGAIKEMAKSNMARYKIFYSYIKFLIKYIGDYYRAVLFCINVIDELQLFRRLEEREFMTKNCDKVCEGLISQSEEFLKIEKKFKDFYHENLEDYNKVLKQYHPEYGL